ncbi:MAG: hypothetical protein Ct9H300mP2_3290 [Candidatus Neomarinimicrobiota bacterium]|nr:MAG: hypothetical protein Ct9H300mP2_3290 [Candidatus Neomarinimicrobiota bacterium]
METLRGHDTFRWTLVQDIWSIPKSTIKMTFDPIKVPGGFYLVILPEEFVMIKFRTPSALKIWTGSTTVGKIIPLVIVESPLCYYNLSFTMVTGYQFTMVSLTVDCGKSGIFEYGKIDFFFKYL